MYQPYKDLFNCAEFSDGKLVVRIKQNACDYNEDEQDSKRVKTEREYYIHRVVLAAHSEYFRSKFLRWSETETSVVYFDVHDQHELDITECVIRCFYNGPVYLNSVTMCLFKMLKICDMLISPLIYYHITLQIPLVCNNVTVDDFRVYYNTSAIMINTNRHEIALFMRKKLCSMFGGDELMKKRSLLTDFVTLPLDAVLALYEKGGPEFGSVLTSENTVLISIMIWLQNKQCTDDELKSLRKVIRVLHLTSTFIEQILPQLKWFDFTQLQKRVMLSYKRIQYSINDVDDFDDGLFENDVIPRQWIFDHRAAGQPHCINVTFTENALDEWIASTECCISVTSKRSYFRGLFFKPTLTLHKNGLLDFNMNCKLHDALINENLQFDQLIDVWVFLDKGSYRQHERNKTHVCNMAQSFRLIFFDHSDDSNCVTKDNFTSYFNSDNELVFVLEINEMD